jgi:hypothetical protein
MRQMGGGGGGGGGGVRRLSGGVRLEVEAWPWRR